MLNKLRTKIKNNKGFTLIELIVVVAIIAVLVAILVPRITGFVRDARETAQLATAKLIWSNAEVARTLHESRGANFADEFEKLFSSDISSSSTFDAMSGQATIVMNNGDTYVVTFSNDNFVVQGPNVTYPDNTQIP